MLDDDPRPGRPPDDAEPPAIPAGQGRARGPQARRLREAARAHVGGVERAAPPRRGERARPLHELQHPLLRALPRGTGAGSARRPRRGSRRPRRLRPGLAPKPTDWNWRLDPGQGALRAVADIGTHWLDLTSFVTGKRIASVFADLHRCTDARVPTGPVETSAAVRTPSSGSTGRSSRRTWRTSCSVTRTARVQRHDLAARGRAEEPPRLRARRRPGLARVVVGAAGGGRGSGIATGRTSLSSATQRSWTQSAAAFTGYPEAIEGFRTRPSSSTGRSMPPSRRTHARTARLPDLADGHEEIVLGEAMPLCSARSAGRGGPMKLGF